MNKARNLAASTIQKWYKKRQNRINMPLQIVEVQSVNMPRKTQNSFSDAFRSRIDEDIMNIENFISEAQNSKVIKHESKNQKLFETS